MATTNIATPAPVYHIDTAIHPGTATSSGSSSPTGAQSPSSGASSVTLNTDVKAADVKDLDLSVVRLDKEGGVRTETSSVTEKGNEWDGYLDEEIEDKHEPKIIRNLRHSALTVYRRIFGIVFLVNLGVFIDTVVRGTNAPYLIKVSIGNLFTAILMRQDHVINAWFYVACSIPPSWPLWIRLLAARVYHIGGIHSGAAFASTLWFLYFTIQTTIDFTQGQNSAALMALTYIIMVLLITIIVFAYPAFRVIQHNRFEQIHRFFGWLITALIWPHTAILIRDYKDPSVSIASQLRISPAFWLVVIMTASIILPWLHLRHKPTKIEVLSKHAMRMYFDHRTPRAGSFQRIATDPLNEWHSFATIAEPGKKGFSLVISRAGDWTSKHIDSPPPQIWIRGVPTLGVMTIASLFRRVVLVGTGSGIGPLGPHIFANSTAIKLLWVGPNLRQTFGDKLVDQVVSSQPDCVLYDTRKHGKPDMVKLTYKLVKEFNAEAVCIISNTKLTQKVVYGMTARGIPAYGAIWDS